jgi:hypothetical protein
MGLLQHKELLMCNEGLNRQIIMKNCAPIHRGTWCTAGVALSAHLSVVWLRSMQDWGSSLHVMPTTDLSC